MSNDLFQTICTIVSDEETRNQRLDKLKMFLINQQYQYKLVEDGIKKASELEREELINPKPRNENLYIQVLPLVTTYNPRDKKSHLLCDN